MRLSSTPDQALITRISYDSDQNIQYFGCAASGSAISAEAWAIVKLIYDSNNNITQLVFAEGNRIFDKIWDDRASYSYS